MTTTQETSKYLDLKSGANTVFLTGVRVFRKDDKNKRTSFKLTFSEQPTNVNFHAPFTSVTVNCPTKEDTPVVKMNMDKQVQEIIFPLLDNPEDGTVLKRSISQIEAELAGIMEAFDIKCEILVKLTEGKSLDKSGNQVMFTNILSLKPLEGIAKGVYDSAVDYED